jgi:hypothetical protein
VSRKPTPAMLAVLARLHAPGARSLDVGGEDGVRPSTARALIRHGYALSWATGEFELWGPFVHIAPKRNDTGTGKEDGFVRTTCSCDAGVLAMKCEKCGSEAIRIEPVRCPSCTRRGCTKCDRRDVERPRNFGKVHPAEDRLWCRCCGTLWTPSTESSPRGDR